MRACRDIAQADFRLSTQLQPFPVILIVPENGRAALAGLLAKSRRSGSDPIHDTFHRLNGLSSAIRFF
jgi:hypothetical protein